MKKKNTIFLALLACGASLFAGEPFIIKKNSGDNIFTNTPELFAKKKTSVKPNIDGKSNIAIKMNLTQLAFRNLSFQAEYGFHKKMSVSLGFSALLKTTLDRYYSAPSGLEDNFSVPTLKGYAITPEFRFYPGGSEDKPAPHGFYIGAYLRYAKYKAEQTVSYIDETTNPPYKTTYSANSTQTYGGVNGGILIGHQWIIGDHFTIDWWIIGGGYGKAKYTYEWVVPGANLSASQQEDVRKQANENFDSFSALGLKSEVTTTPNSAKMSVTGVPMLSLRFMGLCLGYAF